MEKKIKNDFDLAFYLLFYQLINSLSDNLKRKYKCLERIKCKVITKKWSIEYNKLCNNSKIAILYYVDMSTRNMVHNLWDIL